jgi:hypothetical protein
MRHKLRKVFDDGKLVKVSRDDVKDVSWSENVILTQNRFFAWSGRHLLCKVGSGVSPLEFSFF